MPILVSSETSGTSLPQWVDADRAGDRCSDESAIDRCGGEMARRIATRLNVPLVENQWRHELLDVSRSPRHRKLFGTFGQRFSAEQKRQLLDEIYQPYHELIQDSVKRILRQFTFVVHLSVRSFDLHQGGRLRRTDVGLLYDPSRVDELDFSLDWIDEQYDLNPNVRVRRNYPRRGTMNYLTKVMRETFPPEQYLGIEVWMNRAWASRDVRLRDEAIESLCESLKITIGITDADSQQVA